MKARLVSLVLFGGRKPVALIVLCLILSGCLSKATSYTEGTKAAIGAYLPHSGQIMGCQVVSYLSGITFATSNETVKISRAHSATNSYLWGMVETREATRTQIETGVTNLEKRDGEAHREDFKIEILKLLGKCLVISLTAIASLVGAGGLLAKVLQAVH